MAQRLGGVCSWPKDSTNMVEVKVHRKRRKVASSWNELTTSQLLALVELVGLNDPARVQIAFALIQLGLRPGRYLEINGVESLEVRDRRGWVYWINLFELENLKRTQDYLFGAPRKVAGLERNPFPRIGNCIGWGDGLSEVQLEEYLLAETLRQRVNDSSWLGCIWRPAKRGRRVGVNEVDLGKLGAQLAKRLGTRGVVLAEWYYRGCQNMLMRRFPSFFTLSEGGGASGSPIELIYTLADGKIGDVAVAREASVWDVFLLLESVMKRNEELKGGGL